MKKKCLKSSFIGIAVAVIIFAVIGMIFDLASGGHYALSHYQYTKMLIGSVVIGFGFGLPSFIYDNDAVPYPIQVIFHMGIGCAVMLITGFVVGWFPAQAGSAAVVLTVVGEIAAAFVVWKCFTVHYRKEADAINRKLNALNR